MRVWACSRVSNVRSVENKVTLTRGSFGGSATMTLAPKYVSVSSVWTETKDLRRLTRPPARSSSEMSGKMALDTPSAMVMPVGAPPPSGTSAMTADFSSFTSPE